MTLSLAPPPTEGSYESVSDALKALNAFAAAEGYAIVKRRSKSWGGMMRRVILKCDKGGEKRKQNPADTEKKRSKSSRLTNCPFSMDLYLKKDEVHWEIYLRNGNHNHTATKAIAHPTHRQLDSPRRREIERQCDAGIAPRQTHMTLLLDSNSTDGNKPVLLSDINNARYRYRALRQGPRTAIQALIDDLQKESWYCKYQTDDSNAIQCCFFAYQKSIHLFQRFSEVVLMDCTYNTNKFNMPLFTITGRTSMNGSFTIAMAFLAGETFEDFQWALHQFRQLYQHVQLTAPITIVTDCDLALIQAIEVIFPSTQHLLCLWHIAKNILTNCKPAFLSVIENQRTTSIDEVWNEFLANWHKIVQSQTSTAFEANWDNFCKKYEQFPSVIRYLQDQWLPHKKRIVYAWTNQHLHFDTRVTSRAEGLHSSFKRHLLINTGDLKRVHEVITHLLDRQINEHEGVFERSKTRLFWDYRGSFFDEIR